MLEATCNAMVVVTALGVFSGLAEPAYAEPAYAEPARAEIERDDDAPWSRGVSAEDRKKAQARYDDGNVFLAANQYRQATQSYKQAIKHWPHPAIHFNLVISQLGEDRFIEAYIDLLEVMKYGPEALDPLDYQKALEFRHRLKDKVGVVRILCNESDAVVTINGLPLDRWHRARDYPALATDIVGDASERSAPGSGDSGDSGDFGDPGAAGDPGHVGDPGDSGDVGGLARLIVERGQYQVEAWKSGYTRAGGSFFVRPGHEQSVTLDLTRIAPGGLTVQRWSDWKPWAVVGAGAAVGLVGGAMHLLADRRFKAYDELLGDLCESGCEADALPSRDKLDSARRRQRVALGLYGVSAALLISGRVLLYLNRERLVSQEPSSMIISVVPTLSPDSVGVMAWMRL